MSTFDKLALGPKGINATAKAVVKPAAPQNLWAPKPVIAATYKHSDVPLATAPLPPAIQAPMRNLIGKSRGRLTIMGYAADQGVKSQQAKWVVRCACGNYEHRTRILRWLHTQADDMCIECQKRKYITRKSETDAPPAERVAGADLQRMLKGGAT